MGNNSPKVSVSVVEVWSTEKGRELLRLNPDNSVTVTPSTVNLDELRALSKAADECANKIQQRTGETA